MLHTHTHTLLPTLDRKYTRTSSYLDQTQVIVADACTQQQYTRVVGIYGVAFLQCDERLL
jgi:hypothetical protein